MTLTITNVTFYVLIFLSIITWTYALRILLRIYRSKKLSNKFEVQLQMIDRKFDARKLVNNNSIYSELTISALDLLDVNMDFYAGKKTADVILEEVRLTMFQRQEELLRKLEIGLAEIASIASMAPFIGLFGTVWGIMDALKNIPLVGAVGMNALSGPLSEALITTAFGIVVALPAIAFYNGALRSIKTYVTSIESFIYRFSMQLVQMYLLEDSV